MPTLLELDAWLLLATGYFETVTTGILKKNRAEYEVVDAVSA